MRFWKNSPYWAKGGMMGLAILFIVSLYLAFQPSCIGIYAVNLTRKVCDQKIDIFSTNLSLTPLLDNVGDVGYSPEKIVTLIVFFSIGAIPGWLYGKIKNCKLNSISKNY